MDNIYIALLFGVPSFFRHAPMPDGRTTLAIMRSCRQQAGGRLKGQGRPAGRQFKWKYRSTLIIRDFSRLFPYDKQLIIRIRYDNEQKEKAVRHSKTDSHKIPGRTAGTGSRSPIIVSAVDEHLSVVQIQRDEPITY